MISFINLILFFLLLWNDPGPPSPQPPVTSTAMKATNLRPVADPEKQLQVTLTSSLSPSNSSVTTTSLMSSLSSVTTPSYFSSSSSSTISSSASHSHHISSSSIEVPPALTSKSFLLYNRCSGGHIRVKGDRIIASTFASTRNKDLFYDYAVMLIQSHNLGSRQEPVIVVSIRGKRSGVFLCFNRRGKLVTRFSRSDHKCMFREEESDNHYMTYESFYNPDWSIGFSRRGRPLTHHHNNSSQHRHHHRKNKKKLKENTREVTVEKLERSAAASSSWSSTSQSSSTSRPSTSSSLSSHFSSTSHYHSSHSLSRSPHSTHKGKCYQFVKRPES